MRTALFRLAAVVLFPFPFSLSFLLLIQNNLLAGLDWGRGSGRSLALDMHRRVHRLLFFYVDDREVEGGAWGKGIREKCGFYFFIFYMFRYAQTNERCDVT